MPTPPNIFGANIAGLIAQNLGPLVFDVTLISVVPTERGLNLTGGNNPTETSYVVKGFVSDYKDWQIDGTIIKNGDRIVTLLGGTLPAGVIPQVGDKITAEGLTKTVVQVNRDPAGATYECQWSDFVNRTK